MDKTPTQWMIEPLRRYAQFGGRARRAEYWWFALFVIVASFAAAGIESVIFGPEDIARHAVVVGGIPLTITQTSNRHLGSALSLILLCPQMAVSFRRLHDIGRSGWWLATPLVILAGLGIVFGVLPPSKVASLMLAMVTLTFVLVGLNWFCTRGTAGPNRFGSDPLAEPAPL